MKNLTIQELNTMLCSTGYLPPRTEDELMFFTQMYEERTSRIENRHVDVEAIINGTCRIVSSRTDDLNINGETYRIVAEESDQAYSMAARNFDKLPKDIIDKMKRQHKPKEDDEE
ncbi:MAG: hypothetical protein PUG76_03940 [Prevotellaceae bacterium]|nr:hypothetical protein [Prevotellaceae bacterium]